MNDAAGQATVIEIDAIISICGDDVARADGGAANQQVDPPIDVNPVVGVRQSVVTAGIETDEIALDSNVGSIDQDAVLAVARNYVAITDASPTDGGVVTQDVDALAGVLLTSRCCGPIRIQQADIVARNEIVGGSGLN